MPARGGFRVTKLYHPTTVVSDLGELHSLYDRWFERQAVTIPFSNAQSNVYRSFILLGDIWIENMSPEQTTFSPFRLFTNTVGNHWTFPAFYADDLQAGVYDLHHRHRIRLTAVGTGLPVTGLPTGHPGRTNVFTHPWDSGTMVEFVEVEPEFVSGPLGDPRLQPDWDPQFPEADDPLGMLGGSHHCVAVDDSARLLHFLVDVCGGHRLAETEHEGLGTRSVFVSLGEDPSVLEIAEPIGDGPVKADVARSGNSYHSLIFRVESLARAHDHLTSCGATFEWHSDTLLVTDPAATLGLRFGFTNASVPWECS